MIFLYLNMKEIGKQTDKLRMLVKFHDEISNTYNVVYVFFLTFFIVVPVQLSPSFPHHSHPPQPSPLPTLDPTFLWFCPCVLYSCSWKPFSLFPRYAHPPPLWLLTVFLNFTVSGSILLACLFC